MAFESILGSRVASKNIELTLTPEFLRDVLLQSRAMKPAGASSISLEELKEKIELFLCDHARPVLTGPGRDVMDLASSSYSLAVERGKLLWHVWNEQSNVVRQITGITRESTGRMELRFQRFGKGPEGSLVLSDSKARPEQLDRRSRRTQYARALRQVLGQLFPQSKILELTSEPDWVHSLSGRYARGTLLIGSQTWAVLGTGEEEDISSADAVLTFGLIWHDWLRRQPNARVIHGLKLFVPAGRADTTVQRLAWLNRDRLRCELYEVASETEKRNLEDIGNLHTNLPPVAAGSGAHQLGQGGTSRGSRSEFAEQILRLDPDVETTIDSGGLRQWSIRGLVFARETQRGITFGLGRSEAALREDSFDDLAELVARIGSLRRSDSPDPAHALYRVYPERWMQSVVRAQLDKLGFDLLPDPVYEQVPSMAGAERGLMDLLALTRQGRLVVIELKASEKIHLPLQALDYWLRVRWHQQRGELERSGYFPGRVISPEPPLLLLVGPALQFHSACDTVLSYFSSAVEVYRLGVNEGWREKLQVVSRTGPGARSYVPEASNVTSTR